MSLAQCTYYTRFGTLNAYSLYEIVDVHNWDFRRIFPLKRGYAYIWMCQSAKYEMQLISFYSLPDVLDINALNSHMMGHSVHCMMSVVFSQYFAGFQVIMAITTRFDDFNWCFYVTDSNSCQVCRCAVHYCDKHGNKTVWHVWYIWVCQCHMNTMKICIYIDILWFGTPYCGVILHLTHNMFFGNLRNIIMSICLWVFWVDKDSLNHWLYIKGPPFGRYWCEDMWHNGDF